MPASSNPFLNGLDQINDKASSDMSQATDGAAPTAYMKLGGPNNKQVGMKDKDLGFGSVLPTGNDEMSKLFSDEPKTETKRGPSVQPFSKGTTQDPSIQQLSKEMSVPKAPESAYLSNMFSKGNETTSQDKSETTAKHSEDFGKPETVTRLDNIESTADSNKSKTNGNNDKLNNDLTIRGVLQIKADGTAELTAQGQGAAPGD